MNLIQSALRRLLTVLVLIVAVVLDAAVAVQRMARDIFPPLGIPTIYVAQPFGGMDPAQMEGDFTCCHEYHFNQKLRRVFAFISRAAPVASAHVGQSSVKAKASNLRARWPRELPSASWRRSESPRRRGFGSSVTEFLTNIQ